MARNFRTLLEAQWSRGNFVCVGLDSELARLPERVRGNPLLFNQRIVDATKDLVCAYKPNVAFYEEHGEEGLLVLKRTIQYIRAVASAVPVILDAKRGDIGNTNKGYAVSAFSDLNADAITINPYLGRTANMPFLEYKDKGITVLCRTSNEDSNEFQDLRVVADPATFRAYEKRVGHEVPEGTLALYQLVAFNVATKWNANSNCVVVVGATYPEELAEVRRIVGDMPILIPGIGAQGGDIEQTVRAGKDSRGMGMIINSSRGIIFASKGEDFAEAARTETIKLRNAINAYRADGS